MKDLPSIIIRVRHDMTPEEKNDVFDLTWKRTYQPLLHSGGYDEQHVEFIRNFTKTWFDMVLYYDTHDPPAIDTWNEYHTINRFPLYVVRASMNIMG